MFEIIVNAVVAVASARLLWALACHLWDVYYTQCCRDKTSSLPLPPGSMGLPIIGETLNIIKQGDFFDKKREKYGHVYKTHILGNPTIRVCGADNVQKILQGEHVLVQSNWPANIRMLFGERSLAMRQGESHTELRRAVQKGFSHNILENFIEVMQTTIQDCILSRWCDKSGDISGLQECKRLTFTLACSLLVGFEFEESEIDILLPVFKKLEDGMWTLPIPIPGTTFHKALEARNIIREKITQALKNDCNSFSVLQHMFGTYNGIHDEETCLQICTEMLLVGHESLASGATGLIFQLGKNPNVIQKVQEELAEHNLLDASSSGSVTMDVLNKMTYVDGVVKELLRMLPPVGGGYRKVKQTFELQGYQIPKGWTVIYSIRETHDVSDVFQDKMSFNPDRWRENNNNEDQQLNRNQETSSNIKTTRTVNNLANKYNYLPFGRGRRICVGKDYATLFFKILTIELVRNCEWTLKNPNPSFARLPALHPQDGLPVTFRRRLKLNKREE